MHSSISTASNFSRGSCRRLLRLLVQFEKNSTRHYLASMKTHVKCIPEEEIDDLKGTKWRALETFNWLREVSPGFPVNSTKIKILHEPSEFYSTLVEKCKSAKKRITLASLYLGTQKLEADLVEAIKNSCKSSEGNVKINILLDYMRGSRGTVNSRTMLLPLLSESSDEKCKLFFYHTPHLRGILKAVIPHRFNELIGLQHMKIYICDDSLIISGANLSNDYFTNRQDRYILIEDCKELCDFYDSLVQRISEFSFQLMPGNLMHYKSSEHPLNSSIDIFNCAVKKKVEELSSTALHRSKSNYEISESDTWVFPLIQMGMFGIHQDSDVTLRLFQTAPTGALLKIATSYLNLTSEYANALLENCQATCELLTAHPSANGFFGAKGVAGGIPAAYTLIEKSFFEQIQRKNLDERIKLKEFIRPGWTYHAKGLWYTQPNHQKPCLTLIGSSNFGYRSVRRDLESQIVLVTQNEELQNALDDEHQRLYNRSEAVTSQTFNRRDRIPPRWVCAVATLFRYYF